MTKKKKKEKKASRQSRGKTPRLLGGLISKSEHVVIVLFQATISNYGVNWATRKGAGDTKHTMHDGYYSIRENAAGTSTCPLHTNSGCGKERRILTGPW